MDSLIEFLNNNKGFISSISIIIGVSFQLAKYIYLKNKKRLSYFIKLNEDKDSSKILIWNSGNNVIKNVDFPIKGRLNIYSQKGQELKSVEILKKSDEYCEINILKSEKEIIIIPEYMEKYEGFILKVMHDDNDAIALKGKIIDNGKIIETNAIRWKNIFYTINMIANFLIYIGCISLVVSFESHFNLDTSFGGKHEWIKFFFNLILVTTAIILYFTTDDRIRKIYLIAEEYMKK